MLKLKTRERLRLRAWTFISLLVGLIFCLLRPGHAMDVTLAWDEDPLVSGYYVYYKTGSSGPPYDGTGALEGPSPVDMPLSQDENLSDLNVVEFTLHDLSEDEDYFFVVTAYDYEIESLDSFEEVFVVGPNNIPDPYHLLYNRGWGISSGDLKGFSVLYHDGTGVVPTLGMSSEIPALEQSMPDVEGVGAPLNLQPSGVFFSTPVTIFIPCPSYSDLSDLGIYYYDDNRESWVLANDACFSHEVQPNAEGWMVPGSRVDHNNEGLPIVEINENLSTVEIEVLHLSGAQIGTQEACLGGECGCFVATLTERRDILE